MPPDYSRFKCNPVTVPFVELRVGDEFIIDFDVEVPEVGDAPRLARVEERTEELLVFHDGMNFMPREFKTLGQWYKLLKVLVVYREHPDVTLYRPVGDKELRLIQEHGRFPPRLPDQRLFYPVTNERYAWEIAEGWNQKDGVHVVKFTVRGDVLARYPVQTVGRSYHTEHWVPAAELEAFNAALVSPIEEIHQPLRGNSPVYPSE